METQRFRQGVREPEHTEEHLVVEVGCGPRGLIADAPEEYLNRFKENPNIKYIGVDINGGYIDEAQGAISDSIGEKLGAAIERVEFRPILGTDLPFPDNSVAEMIYSNVFGEPRISVENKKAMLAEALRVLKQGGGATIVEDITPQVLERIGLLKYGAEVFGAPPEVSMETVGVGILGQSPHALVATFKKSIGQ